jgi:hypothetical protein
MLIPKARAVGLPSGLARLSREDPRVSSMRIEPDRDAATMRALIIGGGIALAPSALALHRAEIEGLVYEAHAPRSENLGRHRPHGRGRQSGHQLQEDHHSASAHRKPPHHSESSPGVEAGVTGTPHCSSRPPSMSTPSVLIAITLQV